MRFECIWCGRMIEVERAGWLYVHAGALSHFDSCDARPSDITWKEMRMTAVQVADTIEKKDPHS